MQAFNPHEVYMEGMKKEPPVIAKEREMQKENMLQLGWFTHRSQEIINDEQALTMKLEQLVSVNPQLAERIARAEASTEQGQAVEQKQTIIFEGMINDSPEATWFRIHFPSDKGLPLAPAYIMILDTFEANPDGAYTKLDQLFQESMTTH